MKIRIISIAICVVAVLFLLAGCNRNESTVGSETSSSETSQSQEESTNKDSEIKRESFEMIHVWVYYWSLEKWIEESSHIVEAKCVDEFSEGRYTYLVFEPVEVLRGTFSEDKIIVRRDYWTAFRYFNPLTDGCGGRESSTYWEYGGKYEVGKEYLLILSETFDMYDSYDAFYIMANTYINKAESGDFHPSMYMKDIKTECIYEGDYGILKQYIHEYSMQHPSLEREKNYIDSDELKEIVAQTPIIVKGNVTSLLKNNWNEGTNRQTCYFKVTETLKGEEIVGEIKVDIPRDSVEVGAGYIFLLNDFGEEYEVGESIIKYTKKSNIPPWFLGARYKMSSRYSLYSVTDTNKVQEIEALIEQSK